MRVRATVLAVACCALLSGCGASASSAAPVLLTQPAGVIDALTGLTIPSGKLGVAANGCVTVGGQYLLAGHGSAVTDTGDGAGLTDIGTYRFGEALPPVYGYERTYTGGNLPAELERCGPGAYVETRYSEARSSKRATTLLTGGLDRGEETTLNGLLHAAGNGCARVGAAYLVAPEGSGLADDGASVSIPGAGSFPFGSGMPALPARYTFYTAVELPAALQACGPGSYTSVTREQDEPVLTYDPVNDSARMVVRPASDAAPPTGLVPGGVLGRRNTCATVGDYFLSAPHGSHVTDDGRVLELEGIGEFTIGGRLPTLPGRLTTYSETTLPDGIIDCGSGTYVEVWPR